MSFPTAILKPEDLSQQQTAEVLDLALALKKDPWRDDLKKKILGMVFFNPSLRTRVSFDVAMKHLGGDATVLDVGSGMWNLEHREDVVMDGDKSEHIREAAAVLGRYTDALAVRAFPKYDQSWEDNRLEPIHEGFAKYSGKPLINMESSLHHPCQGLADILTLKEKLGDLKKQPIVISWAWHPKPLPMAVTNSILLEACKAGMEVRLAHPEGWDLDEDVIQSAKNQASTNGGTLNISHDFEESYEGARAVYVKSWGSIRNYGQPDKEMQEALAYKGKWQLTSKQMKKTSDGIHLHCLPVRRGVEITSEVLDSPASVVIDEAENRLHVQKALLLKLLGGMNS